MRPSYHKKFQALENRLEELFQQLDSIPTDRLNQKASPGGWSPLEVAQHMLLVERASLAYVEKKSSFPEQLEDAGLFEFLSRPKLALMMRLPVKIKAPKLVNESHFVSGIRLEEIFAEWRTFRKELYQFLENFPPEFHRKLTYKHPIAGRLTLDNMLYVLIKHFDRHNEQINRMLSETLSD